MMSQNVDDGYSEACVRALSKSFLREEDYQALVSCNTLDEFKQVLDETDYGKYIISADGSRMDSIELKQKLYHKLRDEIEYIMANSTAELGQFLQIMMHYYQIENVVAFISGVKNKQDPGITKKALNPLGEFSGLKSVSSFASDNFVSMFEEILIDLPVGEYFRKFINGITDHLQQQDKDQNKRIEVSEITKIIDNHSASEIKVMLKKIWLITFHRWI